MALTRARAKKIVREKTLGAVLGVCGGDALGGPTQFKARGSFEEVADFEIIVQFGRPAGSWSDDGSMTLCLAQSLVDQDGEFDKSETIKLFCRWHIQGFYSSADWAWDIGISTDRSLRIWNEAFRAASEAGRSLDVATTQIGIDEELKTEECSGNGSLMRVVPVGAALFRDEELAVKIAREQSEITHPYPACADACEIYTRLIIRVMNEDFQREIDQLVIGEKDKAKLAKSLHERPIEDPKLRTNLKPYDSLESWKAQEDKDIGSEGWVVTTLEAALWGFFNFDDFESGVLKVVNFGGDSDTIGAIYGGLAGAYYGVEAIPERWRKGLVKSAIVESVAADLAGLAAQSSGAGKGPSL